MSDGHQFICRRNSHRCRRTLFLMRESFRIHPVFFVQFDKLYIANARARHKSYNFFSNIAHFSKN